MPFVSSKQNAKCWAMKAKGEAGSWNCEEWAEHTDYSKIPEKKATALLPAQKGLISVLRGITKVAQPIAQNASGATIAPQTAQGASQGQKVAPGAAGAQQQAPQVPAIGQQLVAQGQQLIQQGQQLLGKGVGSMPTQAKTPAVAPGQPQKAKVQAKPQKPVMTPKTALDRRSASLIKAAMERVLFKKAAERYREKVASQLVTYLGALASKVPLEKSARARQIQFEIARGSSLGVAIKKACHDLSPEARGALAYQLVQGALRHAKQANLNAAPGTTKIPTTQTQTYNGPVAGGMNFMNRP